MKSKKPFGSGFNPEDMFHVRVLDALTRLVFKRGTYRTWHTYRDKGPIEDILGYLPLTEVEASINRIGLTPKNASLSDLGKFFRKINADFHAEKVWSNRQIAEAVFKLENSLVQYVGTVTCENFQAFYNAYSALDVPPPLLEHLFDFFFEIEANPATRFLMYEMNPDDLWEAVNGKH